MSSFINWLLNLSVKMQPIFLIEIDMKLTSFQSKFCSRLDHMLLCNFDLAQGSLVTTKTLKSLKLFFDTWNWHIICQLTILCARSWQKRQIHMMQTKEKLVCASFFITLKIQSIREILDFGVLALWRVWILECWSFKKGSL